jgi:fucose permease
MTEHRFSRLSMLLAFVAFISLGLPDAVLGVAWPSMRHSFQLPVSRIGLLLTGNMVGYLTSSFFAGQVVRMLGVGRLLAFSGMLVTLALAGVALSPAWPPLILFAVVGGLGAGAIDSGINAFAAQQFSARVVNWLHAFFGVGATIGPLLMTTVLAAGLGWRPGYGILAGLLGALTIVFFRTIRLWDLPVVESTETTPAVASLTEALRRPMVWAHTLLFFIYCGIESTAGQLLFSLFRESRGLSIEMAGAAIVGYWASLTVGRILFGQIVASTGPLPVLRFAMLLIPLAAAFIWWSSSAWVGLAATWLLGFSLAPIFPTLISVTPARVGSRLAPHAIGLQVSAATLGIAFFPAVVAILARKHGLEIVPVELTAAGVLLVVLHEAIERAGRDQPMTSATE